MKVEALPHSEERGVELSVVLTIYYSLVRYNFTSFSDDFVATNSRTTDLARDEIVRAT